MPATCRTIEPRARGAPFSFAPAAQAPRRLFTFSPGPPQTRRRTSKKRNSRRRGVLGKRDKFRRRLAKPSRANRPADRTSVQKLLKKNSPKKSDNFSVGFCRVHYRRAIVSRARRVVTVLARHVRRRRGGGSSSSSATLVPHARHKQ